VTRDLDLLTRLRDRGNLITVNMTITTIDTGLARKLEPRAPRPDLRLRAIRELADAGIKAGVSYAPVMPLINDRRPQMEALAQAAVDAGAQWMWGGVLFLSTTTKPVFLAFLEREFPNLLAKYQQHYAAGAYLRGEYPARIAERIAAIRERFGLKGRGEEESRWEQGRRLLGDDTQMTFDF
jgi:DNA repair photolyase